MYNIFLVLFNAGIRVAAIFNGKARKWVSGRRGIFEKLEAAVSGNKRVVWMHCASLGEFEQGRPLLEKLRLQYPDHRFLLTFFSPSGYEVRKDYKGADWVFYLPMDGPRNARRFLEIVNPQLVIFVKYEFWYYYLKKVKYRNIPLILVSALFWEKMSFFKWYGALQRKMLSRFDHLFVQDPSSKRLLDALGLQAITSISGDTRFDRVIAIASPSTPVPAVENWKGSSPAIIAGSTWPEDELLLKEIQAASPTLKLILAPHEISEKHLADLQQLFPNAILYSKLNGTSTDATHSVLIIDNIGLLSKLYQYAFVSYIGGGFGKGIHNTLEAAVYGRPVMFGTVYHKFREARELIANKGAVRIQNAAEGITALHNWINVPEQYDLACQAAKDYVYGNKGATDIISSYIQEKRLLTS